MTKFKQRQLHNENHITYEIMSPETGDTQYVAGDKLQAYAYVHGCSLREQDFGFQLITLERTCDWVSGVILCAATPLGLNEMETIPLYDFTKSPSENLWYDTTPIYFNEEQDFLSDFDDDLDQRLIDLEIELLAETGIDLEDMGIDLEEYLAE